MIRSDLKINSGKNKFGILPNGSYHREGEQFRTYKNVCSDWFLNDKKHHLKTWLKQILDVIFRYSAILQKPTLPLYTL